MNNNVMVIEINTFRLIFKIMEKIKKYEQHAKEVYNALGNEVLKRVNNLKSFCCDEDENSKLKQGLYFGVK